MATEHGVAAMENSLAVPQMVKHGVTIWCRNFTAMYVPKRIGNICSYKKLSANVHSTVFHDSWKMGTTQRSISWWIERSDLSVQWNIIQPSKGSVDVPPTWMTCDH